MQGYFVLPNIVLSAVEEDILKFQSKHHPELQLKILWICHLHHKSWLQCDYVELTIGVAVSLTCCHGASTSNGWDCSIPRATGNWEVWSDEPQCRWSGAQHGDALALFSQGFQGVCLCESKFLMKCVSCYNWSIKFLCKRRTRMREHRKEIMVISLHRSNICKFWLCFFPDFLDDDYR